MAIRIALKDEYVKFSTGAGEMLFDALARIAKRLDEGEQAKVTVTRWLSSYTSGLDLNLHPLPSPLDSPKALLFFIEVTRSLCVELSQENPCRKVIDIAWSRALRLSWLARLLTMESALAKEIPPSDLETFCLVDDLSPADRAQCEFYQLDWRWKQANKVGDRKKIMASGQLLVDLAKHSGHSLIHPESISDVLTEVAQMLSEQGDHAGASDAYSEAARLEVDPEMKAILLELVSKHSIQGGELGIETDQGGGS